MEEPSVEKLREVPQDIIEPLCRAVGWVIVNWTFVEQNLTYWSYAAYHRGGARFEPKGLPRNFKKKVGFLRKAFREVDFARPFAAECVPYLDAAAIIVKTRDYLAHGTIHNYEPVNDVLVFAKVDNTKDQTDHQHEFLRLPLTDLIEQGNQCVRMTTSMIKISARIDQAFVAQNKANN